MAGTGIPKAFQQSGLAGDAIFFDGKALSTPGTTKTIFTVVVGAGVTLNLTQINCSGQFGGVFRVLKNSEEIATLRVRPGKTDPSFGWFPARPISEGDTITVNFEQRLNSPAVQVEAYLMGAQET